MGQSNVNELIQKYMPRIYAFALRLCGDPELAEDITAETCIKVWKHIDSFDVTKSVNSWIFTIARNTAYDFFRKRKNVAFSRMMQGADEDQDFEETIVDENPGAELVFDGVLSQKLLNESLQKLTLEKRTIVLLHDIEGLTFDEIAAVVNKPSNTVKSTYRRTLLGLQKEMHQKRQL